MSFHERKRNSYKHRMNGYPEKEDIHYHDVRPDHDSHGRGHNARAGIAPVEFHCHVQSNELSNAES